MERQRRKGKEGERRKGLEERPAPLTSEKRLMIRSAFLRRVRNARQQRFLYVSNISLFWKHKQQIWLEFAATFSLPLHP